METAQIYVTGSGDPHTRLGFARVLIEQGSRKTPFIFNYEDTTYKRSQIQGMIDAVLQLNCPHYVVFISASPLALEKAEIGEGPNRDLIYELYRVLATKGCTYTFDFRVGHGKEIDRLLSVHGV
ncbi:hypothetical protein LQK91_21380 [Pantoea sp. MHSD4]|uniref:hypothetical protein n=1 Tax=Gammaproteobacteria TaxID=1236 RepID=UPI000CF36EC3|nr:MULTISPECIES: hypothetical protein [Gammaproteobacteria]MCD2358957.1 hypothetical protein [Pantoea sp. MHSD4]PQL26257.1 hypothetical protein C5L22_21590 [Pantoea ananatis]